MLWDWYMYIVSPYCAESKNKNLNRFPQATESHATRLFPLFPRVMTLDSLKSSKSECRYMNRYTQCKWLESSSLHYDNCKCKYHVLNALHFGGFRTCQLNINLSIQTDSLMWNCIVIAHQQWLARTLIDIIMVWMLNAPSEKRSVIISLSHIAVRILAGVINTHLLSDQILCWILMDIIERNFAN